MSPGPEQMRSRGAGDYQRWISLLSVDREAICKVVFIVIIRLSFQNIQFLKLFEGYLTHYVVKRHKGGIFP